MNPAVSRESLEYEFISDPDSARVEYGAEFMEGAGAFVSATAIHECVVRDRRALPPVDGLLYYGAIDPAFARMGDEFTFAIGHGEGDTFVLDRLEAWRGRDAPLNSDRVLDEIAAICRQYRLSVLTSDQFALTPLADAFRRRDIHLRGQPLTNDLKADTFGSLKRAINLGEIAARRPPACRRPDPPGDPPDAQRQAQDRRSRLTPRRPSDGRGDRGSRGDGQPGRQALRLDRRQRRGLDRVHAQRAQEVEREQLPPVPNIGEARVTRVAA